MTNVEIEWARAAAPSAELEELKRQLREARRLRAESDERFRALVAGLQVGVVVQIPSGEIVFSNPMALELLGLTEDQMLGRRSIDPAWSVIHEDGSPFPGETHPVMRAIATKRPVRNVVMGVFRPMSEDRVWILVNAMPQLDERGELVQVVCTFTDISERRETEALARQQAEMLAELSTPLIPISDDAVVLPLIGAVDEQRAAQVLEALLSGISGRRARIAILDITGVPVVDMQVAEAFIRAARAVRLLGAQMVITGVRPGVAQILVGLGVELSGILTLSTLQSGIAYALSRR